jgi:hypothetical protein
MPNAVSANVEAPMDKHPDPDETVQQSNPAQYPDRGPTKVPKAIAVGTGMFLPAVIVLVVAVILILWLVL